MSSDSEVELSPYALQALQEFMAEKQQQEKELRSLQSDKKKAAMKLFVEDWQLSQFWYNQATRKHLADQLLAQWSLGQNIAIISAPSVFLYIIENEYPEQFVDSIVLFEYDKRFEVLPQFKFYDFNEPLVEVQQKFDIFLIDPPFLSEECFGKVCQTFHHIKSDNPVTYICTGLTMKSFVESNFGVREASFRPQHEKGLSNEFRLYSSLDLDVVGK